MAGIAIHEKRFSDAESYLQPLRQRKRLHTTEYSALCQAQSELHAAQGNYEAANSWRKMWEDYVAETS